MSSEDWYRNTTWNPEIEKHFMDKLGRARNKDQYLRIQAFMLTESEPEIAIRLLNMYFELDDKLFHAQAYCDYATAYLALGNIDDAIKSFESALEKEKEFSNIQTDAYLAYPEAVIKNKLTEYFEKANSILDENVDRLAFPIEHFKWHAFKAIILNQFKDYNQASTNAEKALNAAEIKKSGFLFHQNLGLVGKEYKSIIKRLRSIIHNKQKKQYESE